MAGNYYLQPPLKQTYYYILAIFTTYCALGDQTWWGFSQNSKFVRILFRVNYLLAHFLAPTLVVSEIWYLVMNFQDMNFNTKGTCFAFLPTTVLVVGYIAATKQDCYIKVMKDFMVKIHLSNLEHQDDYVLKKRIQVEKLTRFTSYYLCSFLTLDWLAWCCVTGINSYHNKDYIQNKTRRLETLIYVVLPFDYEYNLKYWAIVHTWNIYLIWAGCAIIIVHNITSYIFVFQLIGHIEILKYRILNEFNQKLTQDEIGIKLIELIKYHTYVLNIFKGIQNGFGVNVAMYYLYNLIATSLNLYQLMAGGEKRNAMVYALMLVFYFSALVVMSFILEEIKRKSEGLSDAVYLIDWVNMSLENRKIYIMFLMRIQPALVFIAAGGMRAGILPMISIAKTSFSLYVMLKEGMKT